MGSSSKSASELETLWRAVIMQAIFDLRSKSTKPESYSRKYKAKLWLKIKNPDFLTVCAYANVEPTTVLAKMQNYPIHSTNRKQL